MSVGDDWLRYWVAANPELDMTNLSRKEFDHLSHLGVQRYDSVIGTRDPDITAFRDAGGKMITWHGLADDKIPHGGSVHYYNRVRTVDSNVEDYCKLFPSPETGHCVPGQGPFPHGFERILPVHIASDALHVRICEDILGVGTTLRAAGEL
jgi:hypothetical protein